MLDTTHAEMQDAQSDSRVWTMQRFCALPEASTLTKEGQKTQRKYQELGVQELLEQESQAE